MISSNNINSTAMELDWLNGPCFTANGDRPPYLHKVSGAGKLCVNRARAYWFRCSGRETHQQVRGLPHVHISHIRYPSVTLGDSFQYWYQNRDFSLTDAYWVTRFHPAAGLCSKNGIFPLPSSGEGNSTAPQKSADAWLNCSRPSICRGMTTLLAISNGIRASGVR
jgi:hypothetical protein